MVDYIHFPNQKAILLLLFACLTITIFINSIYRHSLYTMGVHIIEYIQHHSNPILDWFFLIITMIIDPAFVFIGIITMVVLSHRKGKGLIMLCFILVNTFFAALIKAYHCDPRPIWTSNSVRNIGFYCPVEYGNPSGHSWFSVILGFGVLQEYRGVGVGYQNIWISVMLIVLVPMSRMYLGAHSLNQVLQGLIFGMFFCLMYVMGLKQILHRFLAEFNHNKTWKLAIITLHILSLIPFIKHMDEELPQAWLSNIHSKCFKDMNEVKLNQLMLTVNALIINVLTGLGMGYEQIVKEPMGAHYLTGRWKINVGKWGRYWGKGLYIGVEVGFILSGLVGALVLYKLHPTFVLAYASLSVGGLVSGYMFTTRAFRFLYRYQIIVKVYPKDIQLVGKDQGKANVKDKGEQKMEDKKNGKTEQTLTDNRDGKIKQKIKNK